MWLAMPHPLRLQCIESRSLSRLGPRCCVGAFPVLICTRQRTFVRTSRRLALISCAGLMLSVVLRSFMVYILCEVALEDMAARALFLSACKHVDGTLAPVVVYWGVVWRLAMRPTSLGVLGVPAPWQLNGRGGSATSPALVPEDRRSLPLAPLSSTPLRLGIWRGVARWRRVDVLHGDPWRTMSSCPPASRPPSVPYDAAQHGCAVEFALLKTIFDKDLVKRVCNFPISCLYRGFEWRPRFRSCEAAVKKIPCFMGKGKDGIVLYPPIPAEALAALMIKAHSFCFCLPVQHTLHTDTHRSPPFWAGSSVSNLPAPPSDFRRLL